MTSNVTAALIGAAVSSAALLVGHIVSQVGHWFRDRKGREQVARRQVYFEAAEYFTHRMAAILQRTAQEGQDHSDATVSGAGGKIALVASPRTLRQVNELEHRLLRIELRIELTRFSLREHESEQVRQKQAVEHFGNRSKQLLQAAEENRQEGELDAAKGALEASQVANKAWGRAIDNKSAADKIIVQTRLGMFEDAVKSLLEANDALNEANVAMREDLEQTGAEPDVRSAFDAAAERQREVLEEFLASMKPEMARMLDKLAPDGP